MRDDEGNTSMPEVMTGFCLKRGGAQEALCQNADPKATGEK